ncbi:MAG: alpha/beta hydrolase, partial [Planctomycetia bacterium]|nr:alpha/beta hydrolase [Planctomycetia bacterium]
MTSERYEFRELRRKLRILAFCVALVAGMIGISGVDGNFGKATSAQIPGINRFDNTQTIGGMFFWQDVFFLQEWHIQRSILTGEYRLLDPEAICRASGSRAFCETVLERYQQELEIPPMSGRVLILLHGFASSSILLENMALWFREKGEYTAVLNISYPSMRVTVAEQAKQLAEIVAKLDGVERIDFVGHSLGAIVLRYYLGNYADDVKKQNGS